MSFFSNLWDIFKRKPIPIPIPPKPMSVFKGNTTADAISPLLTGNNILQQFIITNKSVGTITLNLWILYQTGNAVSICPENLQLSPGQSYADRSYEILAGEQVKLSVSGGEVDYYFFFQPTV